MQYAALVLSILGCTSCKDADVSSKRDANEGLVVFSSNRDGKFHLYTCAPDGSDRQRLTFSDQDDSYPSWSPSGDQVAFIAGDVLTLLDWKSRSRRSLNVTVDSETPPAWSPDGTKILFINDEALRCLDLTTMATSVVAKDFSFVTATWMPKGETMLVSCGQIPTLQILSPDKNYVPFVREMTELYIPKLAGVWSTEAAPRCAFAATNPDSFKTRSSPLLFDVFTCFADGTGCSLAFATPGLDLPWAWSPNGRGILVSSEAPGMVDLFVQWLDTKMRVNLTNDATEERGGSWRR